MLRGDVAHAFGTSVVPGLERVDRVDSVVAMRGIISEAGSNILFVLLLIGSAVLAIAVGVIAITRLRQPGSGYLLAGAVHTGRRNRHRGVQRAAQQRLNAVDPVGLSAADAAREWQAYVGPWLMWNCVRCVSAVAGAILLTAGLLALARRREPAAIV
ncbi:MAG: hypothetical protein ABWY39_09760 [Mycobacterium sp.]